jgi:hypothetical protein
MRGIENQMLNGKKVGGMEFDNGSSVEFLNLGEETVSSLTEKLNVALRENEELRAKVRNLESQVDTQETDAP